MPVKNKNLYTPVAIMEAALKKEEEAYHFYDSLLQDTRVVVVQELLEKLRDEESKHIHLIKQMLTKIKIGK